MRYRRLDRSHLASADQNHIYVGRNTSSGNRDFYFYTSNLEQLHKCLEGVLQKFPTYKFDLGGREDAGWSTYLDFLYPNPMQEQQMMDRGVWDQLIANGDDISLDREIDHRVYFAKKSKMIEYKKFLQTEGYVGISTGRTKPLIGERFIDFKHIGAPLEVSSVVYDLFKRAQELGGTYDGWGCEVVKVE